MKYVSVILLAFMILVAPPLNAQSTTGYFDKVEQGRSVPEMWRLTDTLRTIAIKSPSALERVEAVNCAKWIEYNIARYPEQPGGELFRFWEWRLRRLIDTCEMFQSNKD